VVSIRTALVSFLVASGFAVCLAQTANAQVNGALEGHVYDPAHGVLKDSKVTARNVATGNEHSRVTDKEGYYHFEALAPGEYNLTASKAGFADSSIPFFVQLNQVLKVDRWDITLVPNGVTGRVLDSAGNCLTDVKVAALSEHSEESHETRTNPNGQCSFLYLPLGDYSILASAESYSGGSISIPINKNKVTVPPITLSKVSGESQSSTPSSGQLKKKEPRAQLVHTVDAVRSSNFSQQQLLSLPIGGATYMRTFDELALLIPGVAPPPYSPGVQGPGIGFGIGTAGEFSVNGMRARSNNFSIDGSDNNDPDVGVRRQGFVAVIPQSLESINDISISTLLWSSEFGRNSGSQVNAVSRYGANSFHGQAYGFFTDSRLDARNGFDFERGVSDGKNPFTRKQAGFVFGGPIKRNRTQFFGSFEHESINASTEQHFSVPASGERRFRGLSRFLASSGFFETFSFGVVTGATPLGNNILSFYPLPNNSGGPYGTNTYTQILPADGRGEVTSFRITRQVTSSSALNARYNFTEDKRVLPSVDRAINSSIESNSRSQNLSVIFDVEIKPALYSLARFSFGRTRLGFSEYPGNPFIFSAQSEEKVETITGPQKLTSSTGPIGELLIEPYSPVGVNAFLFPQGRVNNTFQFADSLYWSLGKHSIKFGANVRRIQLNSRQDRLYRPLVAFGNGVVTRSVLDDSGQPVQAGPAEFFPGLELATLGLPSYVLQAITIDTPDSTIGLRFTEYGLFVKDNYRLRENLTLDYGLRYEYNSVPRDVSNRIEDSLLLKNLSTEGLSKSEAPFQEFKRRIDAYSKIVDGRTSIYEPDRNNIGPQVGFAWDPWSDGKTAVRAGYGVYYDTILGAVVSQSRNVFPKEIPINSNFGLTSFLNLNNPPRDEFLLRPLIRPGTLNQLAIGQGGLLEAISILLLNTGFAGGGLSFTLPQKNLRTPYAQQWHLTVEREVFSHYFLSAAYVGTKGSRLTRLTTPNLGPQLTRDIPFVLDGPTPNVFESFSEIRPLRRPNTDLGAYQIIESSAKSAYHAMQFEARKRYSRSFLFTIAYTWSHAIDDVSDLFPIAGAPVLAQNQSNLRLERGNASFDVRHRFASSYIWDLPFPDNSTHPFARLLRHWQIAAIFQANTGQPFTLNLPLDANQDGNLTDRPRTTDGLIFFKGHGPRRVARSPDRSINDFFRFGEDGFVGRNTLRGDSFVNLDLALTKSVRFSDKQRLEFRSEFFNLLNRENFGLPIRTLGAPGFGSSVDTISPARIIQFALKFQF
jgi:carboxypeptidase family protein/TonB-dependent receptor-like protein